MKIGAQLYTVRKSCTDTAAFAETLKRVADIGYTEVQVSGTCAFEADWLAEQLKQTGLTCVLTHTKPERILQETQAICEEHKIFGCRNIGLGMIPGGKDLTAEKYAAFVRDFKPAAKVIAANGCQFFFHNHCEEFTAFSDGESAMEKMLRDFTPEELQITLDVYWAQYAGRNVNEVMEMLKGRLHCVHLKDMTVEPTAWEHRMAPVGRGNMNFESLIRTAEACGACHLLVEQDNCYGEDPFDCLAESYAYLRSLGLS